MGPINIIIDLFYALRLQAYHVDGEFTEIGIELTGESETGSNTRHCGWDQMVQVTIGWGSQFQCSKIEINFIFHFKNSNLKQMS